MNQLTRFTMDIYQVGVVIRSTFEYFIEKKEGHRVDVYKQRKAILHAALTENHPFSKFLADNGETGTKIRGNVQDFYDLVYSDTSRAVFLEGEAEGEKVIVDSGYFLQITDYIVGLHETINDICNGFLNHGKTNGLYEEDFEELLKQENICYRSIAGLIISDQIRKLYGDFVKAMNENKGQPSPQSNFVSNDISKMIGFFKFVEEHAKLENQDYLNAVEQTKLVVDYMGGKPRAEGTGTLEEEFNKLHQMWMENVNKYEIAWHRYYVGQVNKLIEYDKEQIALREQQSKTEENN